MLWQEVKGSDHVKEFQSDLILLLFLLFFIFFEVALAKAYLHQVK